MQDIFDSLIIETYPQLMAVCVSVAILATLVRLLWLRPKGHRAVQGRTVSRQPRATKSTHDRKQTPHKAAQDPQRPVHGMDFDKLATVISEANDRAGHVTQTQSDAALKLDAAEMAVIRMLAEIDGIMTIPGKAKRPAPVIVTPIAVVTLAPVVPLPIRTHLAA